MKKIFFLTLFLIVNLWTISAQSTDRFIRVVGNAKTEFIATKVSVVFTIVEVQPNEYRSVKYKPMETVSNELTEKLKSLGFPASALQKINDFSGYQNFKTEKYKLEASVNQLPTLFDIAVEGAKIGEIKYIYDAPSAKTEEMLSVNAIKDAERKAKNLAAEMGKKVGKVLNVEDKSSGCCQQIEPSGLPKVSQAYKITVTFELLD